MNLPWVLLLWKVLFFPQRGAQAWSPVYHPIPWYHPQHQQSQYQHQPWQQGHHEHKTVAKLHHHSNPVAKQFNHMEPVAKQFNHIERVSKQYNQVRPVAKQYKHPSNRHLREVVFQLKARMIMSGNVIRAARRGQLPYNKVRQLGVHYPAATNLRYPLDGAASFSYPLGGASYHIEEAKSLGRQLEEARSLGRPLVEYGGDTGVVGEAVWSGAGVLGPPPGFELEESVQTSYTELSADAPLQEEPIDGGGGGGWGRVKQAWRGQRSKAGVQWGSDSGWNRHGQKKKSVWKQEVNHGGQKETKGGHGQSGMVSSSQSSDKVKPKVAGQWQGTSHHSPWSKGVPGSKVNSIHHVHGGSKGKAGSGTCYKEGLYLADSTNHCGYQQCVHRMASPVHRPCPPGLAVSPLFTSALSNPCIVYDDGCHTPY